VINKVAVNCKIPPVGRGAYDQLKLASLYSSRLPTPTEDAKASSAFFHIADFTGAYGVPNFSNNTLRVRMFAVAPGHGKFTHLQSLTDCVYLSPPPPPY
jgi:hypothetical protein